jgi:hypothetical protein
MCPKTANRKNSKILVGGNSVVSFFALLFLIVREFEDDVVTITNRIGSEEEDNSSDCLRSLKGQVIGRVTERKETLCRILSRRDGMIVKGMNNP